MIQKIFKYLIIPFFFFVISGPLISQDLFLKFNHITVSDGLPQNTVYSIVEDKYGFMWFGTWGGAIRYDGYNFKVFRADDGDSTGLPDSRIWAIVTDSVKNIWIATGERDYLNKYNYELENFTRIILDQAPTEVILAIDDQISGTVITAQNKLYKWIANKNGLQQINLKTNNIITYYADQINPFSLTDNQINSIYLDETGNIWLGTQNGGINHANINLKPFRYYYSGQHGKGLVDNLVRAVCIDKKGKLWIGSENQGITIIYRVSGVEEYSYIGKEILNNLEIRALYCDSKGFVWIGTKGGGLSYYNPRTNKFNTCTSDICQPWVFDIFEDYYGRLWVGTFYGLAIYDRTLDRFNCLDPHTTTRGIYIRDILEDRHHNLWIATEYAGVTKFEQDTSNNDSIKYKFIEYVHQRGNENSLINNVTYSLAEDQNGMIWIATNSGLSCLNPYGNTFKHFTKENGLPNELIMGVLFDGNESMWVSHKKGLTRINTNTYEMKSFNMLDGIQGNEFNQNTCYQHKESGEMFFGGTNGLNSFFSDSVKINFYKPSVVFTELSIMQQVIEPGTKYNNRVILNKSLVTTDEIALSWADKTFRLEFAALNFANPTGNKYKYKLEGYDEQWTITDATIRFATYSYLPAGKYVFKVLASNSDGIWCDSPAELKIIVLPPWWLTSWAILVYCIIGLIFIWFIYNYIVSRIKLKKNEEIHQAKLQLFTEVSHEFITPLTLIIDPLEKIIYDKIDKPPTKHHYQLMYRNAKQLLLLINQLLDFRKLEAGHLTLNIQNSDIIECIRDITAAFESKAVERNIDFSFESSLKELKVNFDKAKLNMIFNNLLSNAFKFTPENGQIAVKVEMETLDNQKIKITVKDTGTGIDKDEQEKIFEIFYQTNNTTTNKEGSGIGLSLTRELVLLHGGEIKVESEAGSGSCFTVILPIKQGENITIPATQPKLFEFFRKKRLIKIVSVKSDISHLPIVLVVDDSADIRNYIKLNFGNHYQIITASNGSEGLQKALDIIPDIVISDVMMPEMNGFELCDYLKKDERTSHVPIILLSVQQSPEAKTKGYKTGADAYVTKPFNTNVLLAQVKNLLEQRQRLRELFIHGSKIEIKKISINEVDEAFLNKITSIIEENLDNEKFEIDALALKVNMSRSQFFRKVKALTNKSTNEFITTLRMNKALEYLISGKFNIAETAYKVGYSLPNNFTRAFLKRFGKTPSDYIKDSIE